ncbi:MAG: Sjogren's syndrome/scleroderma autoantigen 1 family protein [Haloferacaceae archaeon]|jgi:uncharacterized Zn finger protein (UPF0148 family)
MSDFDREEERERLREKYERDQEKRQSTQRMSELLLRGATMTDSHCDDCGDPIFRYDGQEFCATCEAEGVPTEGDETAADAGSETAEPSAEPTPGDGSSPQDAGARAPTDAAENGRTPPDPRTTSAGRAAPAGERVQNTTTPEPADAERDRTSGRSADLGAARDSLARTVARFARRAEETEGPREAADHLAAAREAAEALAALDRR